MKLNYSDVIGTAWKSLRDDLPLVAGLTLVYVFGAWVLNHIPFGGLIGLPMGFGYVRCLLQIRKKETIGWEDFLWGFLNFNRFLHLVLLQFLVGMGMVIGFILLLVPGFWWLGVTAFTTPLFMLRKEDAVESITKSMELVKGRWWNVFGLILVLALLNLAGALCFLVGILVSIPVSALAMVVATEKLLVETQPPTTPPASGDSEFRPVDATVVSQT